MSKNFKLLYDIRQIKKFFDGALNLDIYDAHTMGNYVKRNTKDLSVSELEIMMNTIQEVIENKKSIQSFFVSLFNGIIVIIAVLIASYMSGYVLINNELIEADVSVAMDYLNQFLMFITFFGIVYVLLFAFYFYWKNRAGRMRNKLYDTVKITINIKNNVY
ncbi:hypothetical protein [Lysinibacillus sp. SGAir0095]|uniref:hypothetical protein n=1 Tax=Lysinibacillus sp. SGAir0095 TaxID=2070463 RepID=UPI0010CCD338|nr:hypothetical protein [Lysinibacillus sp. SGAir0095]QCR32357.1 hypothetical protein C1N55_09290 [Lysinibacillus sp. SGAir0095]